MYYLNSFYFEIVGVGVLQRLHFYVILSIILSIEKKQKKKIFMVNTYHVYIVSNKVVSLLLLIILKTKRDSAPALKC